MTTNLTVNPVYHVSEDIYITEGESYEGWMKTGKYIRTLTSISGCDSVVTTNLTVSLNKYTTEDIAICEGTTFKGWTTSGEYKRTLTAASGADSIVTTNLTVNPVYHVSEDIYITEGESYQGWRKTGKYIRTLTSISGCDSVVTTNLTVSLNKYTTEDISICEGSSYKGWTTSGEYKRTLKAASGADSIVTTNLFVTPVSHTSEDIYIHEGESYQGWTSTGKYERTLSSSTGCDSIVTTNLTVSLNIYTTEDITICEGSSYEGRTTTGRYQRILTAQSGVDSIVTTNLYVNPVVHVSEDIVIREGESYQGWTENGQYVRTLSASTGCDSIVTTHLQVTAGKYTAENIEICEGYEYNGWTTSGQYLRTLTAASGADSIVSTNLLVNPVYKVTEDIMISAGDSYQGWTETGEYQRTLSSVTGCDSVITTRLTVNELQQQTVHLEKGWNIFSSYLVPENNNMEVVMADLLQENQQLIVQDETGNTYKKSGNDQNNNIVEIDSSEGYKIKVQNSGDLNIKGNSVKLPLNIPLKKGWNIISFPYNGSVDALKVLQPLIEAGILEKVQDEQGNSIENWGNSLEWINGIGNFNAGEGYLVQVNQNGILPILENYEKTGHLVINSLVPAYFNVDYEGNGSGHMNINIENLAQSGLRAGDEIAAYDGEICVGAVKLSESNINMNAVSIAASVSDENMENGFTEGHPIEIRVWHWNKSAEIQSIHETIEGKMVYQRHSSVFVNILAGTTGTIDFKSMMDVKVYPNPASEYVTLEFTQKPEPGTRIILTDLTGKQLMIHKVQSTREVLNVQSFPAGIYLVKTEYGGIDTVNKLIVK